MLKNYKHTAYASYIGYITQAIVNNVAPLLFLIFQDAFSLSLSQITALITVNFCVQLFVDLISAKIIKKTGYKPCVVAAHAFAFVGVASLSFLPFILSSYLGILLCVIIYAVGGGLLEVLISPIVEACPFENKKSQMSLLHSFYCWGVAGVVLFSTVFLFVFSKDAWKILCLVLSLVPLFNCFYFYSVPVNTLEGDTEKGNISSLLKNGSFWLFLLLMVAAGASEQAMGQWSSAFAESGLNVSKTVGDLLGPCSFALLMGTSRLLYAKFSEKINLLKCVFACGILCVVSYLVTAFSPVSVISLIGCAVCGFSVGIFWPGVFSLASERFERGGVGMFALLSLAGDLGCASGPTLSGCVSSLFGDSLNMGMAASVIFPVLLIAVCSFLIFKKVNKK